MCEIDAVVRVWGVRKLFATQVWEPEHRSLEPQTVEWISTGLWCSSSPIARWVAKNASTQEAHRLGAHGSQQQNERPYLKEGERWGPRPKAVCDLHRQDISYRHTDTHATLAHVHTHILTVAHLHLHTNAHTTKNIKINLTERRYCV